VRVLHCIYSLSGAGAELQMRMLTAELSRRGYDVDIAFVYQNEDWMSCRYQSASIHLHRLGSGGKPHLGLLRQIVRLVRTLEPEVIQTWLPPMDLLGGIAARLTGAPWVLREASSKSCYRGSWKEVIRTSLARNRAIIVSNSRGGDDYWRTRAPKNLRLMAPNGLPLNEIRAARPIARAQLGVPEDAGLVLYVGRLEALKNLDQVIRALETANHTRRVYGVLCGVGQEEERLKALAQRNGLAERIRFAGWAFDPFSYMKAADVLVHFSDYEGRPNSVLEAMACGCPVIVSDIPAHREFLDEHSAVFVPQAEEQRLAEAILEALAGPEAARRRAAVAMARAQQWTIGATADVFERAYSTATRKDAGLRRVGAESY